MVRYVALSIYNVHVHMYAHMDVCAQYWHNRYYYTVKTTTLAKNICECMRTASVHDRACVCVRASTLRRQVSEKGYAHGFSVRVHKCDYVHKSEYLLWVSLWTSRTRTAINNERKLLVVKKETQGLRCQLREALCQPWGWYSDCHCYVCAPTHRILSREATDLHFEVC